MGLKCSSQRRLTIAVAQQFIAAAMLRWCNGRTLSSPSASGTIASRLAVDCSLQAAQTFFHLTEGSRCVARPQAEGWIRTLELFHRVVRHGLGCKTPQIGFGYWGRVQWMHLGPNIENAQPQQVPATAVRSAARSKDLGQRERSTRGGTHNNRVWVLAVRADLGLGCVGVAPVSFLSMALDMQHNHDSSALDNEPGILG